MSNKNIKKSVEIVFENIKHFTNLEKFARSKLYESVVNESGTFIEYVNTEIISKEEIKINYILHYACMEDCRHITVKL